MFAVFCVLRGIWHGILRLIRYIKEKDSRKSYNQIVEEELLEENEKE